jgi:hypothetical protein
MGKEMPSLASSQITLTKLKPKLEIQKVEWHQDGKKLRSLKFQKKRRKKEEVHRKLNKGKKVIAQMKKIW